MGEQLSEVMGWAQSYSESDWWHVTCWVTQGSILSPTFFNIFINGLGAPLEWILSKIKDDTKLGWTVNTLRLRKARQRDLITVCNFHGSRRRGADTNLSSLLTTDRTWLNGLKKCQERFRSDVRKRFFTHRVGGHWNRLPRGMVTSLTEFKVHLDNILSHVVGLLGTVLCRARCQTWWSWCVPTNSGDSMVLWFCDQETEKYFCSWGFCHFDAIYYWGDQGYYYSYPEICTLQLIFHSLLVEGEVKMLYQTFLLELMASPIR